MTFDAPALRRRFPLIAEQPVTYLDNAATTQKPDVVLDAIRDYYTGFNANVHRGAHQLSEQATTEFESARGRLARFINAGDPAEVIFTRGTTESINLVAQSFAAPRLGPGDEILISELEHHSNIVPWQQVCQRTGARLRAARVTAQGEIDRDDFRAQLSAQTSIVAIGHVSNALGTINPVAELLAEARAVGAVTVLDGAQATAHVPVDVQALDCDFYALSGHKMYGPTGIGALYGRRSLLEEMPPWQGGGEMIEHVTLDATTYAALPYKFEAGTPNIAGAIALGAAVDFLTEVDAAGLACHEAELLARATSGLQQIEGLKIVGSARNKIAIVSFLLEGCHPHDVGTLLDQQGVAVRTGHHCTMPLMQRLAIPGTVRASFSLYNSPSDVDKLIQGVQKAREML